MPTVDVSGVSKSFGSTPAVSDVSFSLEGGEIFGLLGPNGAGKSTLVKTLLSIVKPSGGSASLNGVDIRLPLARHGITIEDCRR